MSESSPSSDAANREPIRGEPRTLSPREVADALGLSESTLKRCANRGELHAVRTTGGHRRIHRDEALRFARRRGLPVLQPEVLGLRIMACAPADGGEGDGNPESEAGAAGASGAPLPGSLARDLHALILEDAFGEARALLLDAFVGGTSVAALCDGPIRECLQLIGDLWIEQKHMGICVEHAATDLMTQALNRMRTAMQTHPAGVEAPLALGASPPGDPYSLPSLMVATVMVDCGFRDLNLGVNTPLETLAEAAARFRPKLVWLASSGLGEHPSAEEVHELARAVEASGARLVVGGRGFDTHAPALSAPHRHHPTMLALDRAARRLLQPLA